MKKEWRKGRKVKGKNKGKRLRKIEKKKRNEKEKWKTIFQILFQIKTKLFNIYKTKNQQKPLGEIIIKKHSTKKKKNLKCEKKLKMKNMKKSGMGNENV